MEKIEGTWVNSIDEIDENGKRVIRADYIVQGIRFKCTLNEQKDGKSMRGRVSITDVKTGAVMQVANRMKEDRLKKNPNADLTIFKEANGQATLKQAGIKDVFIKKVDEIFQEFEDSINANLKTVNVGDLHPMMSLHVYKKSFFMDVFVTKSAAVRAKKEADLEEICLLLGDKKLKTITKQHIASVYKNLGSDKAAEDQVKLLGQYLGHCMDVRQKENPCDLFLENIQKSKKKDYDSLIKSVFAPKSLRIDENVLINHQIANAEPDDGLATSLLLVKELGLISKKATELLWQQILWENDKSRFVRVALSNEGNSGATHNYTKPCSSFAGSELRRRYDWAVEKFGDKVDEQTVVAKQGRKKVQPTEVADFCRQSINAVKKQLGQEPSGDGITLLLRNYEHQLIYTCGLPTDGGAVKFLEGHSLMGNVTADHYRTFVSGEAQRLLYGFMRRSERIEPPEEKVEQAMVAGKQVITVYHMEVERFARLEGKLIVPAGTGLGFGAEYGVNGFVEVTAVTNQETAEVLVQEIIEAPTQKAPVVAVQKTKKEVQDVDQLSLEI